MNTSVERLALLSDRELEVVRLAAQGYTNKQIGERLGISWRTAKQHVQNALCRLGLDSRYEFARLFAGEVDWVALRLQLAELTPSQHRVLLAFGREGSRQGAAQRLGTSYENVQHTLYAAQMRLGPEAKGRLLAIARFACRLSQIEETPLSQRELEIVQEIANGYSHHQISRRLGISRATVKNHSKRILDKLGLADCRQIVLWAQQHGWIDDAKANRHLRAQRDVRLAANGGGRYEW